MILDFFSSKYSWFHIKVLVFGVYTHSMEAIYLSLVHTGSCRYLFYKIPGSRLAIYHWENHYNLLITTVTYEALQKNCFLSGLFRNQSLFAHVIHFRPKKYIFIHVKKKTCIKSLRSLTANAKNAIFFLHAPLGKTHIMKGFF